MDASRCQEKMHGRFFAEKKIECFPWDGSNYSAARETQEETDVRDEEFGKYLDEVSSEEESDDEDDELPMKEHSGRTLPALGDTISSSDEEEE